MNFNFAFGELHSDKSINDKNNSFENYIPKCYKVKEFKYPSIVFLSIHVVVFRSVMIGECNSGDIAIFRILSKTK